MQARYYDPVIGRFLSIDPVPFMAAKPYMFNRYAYTGNNPMNRTDPTGMADDSDSDFDDDWGDEGPSQESQDFLSNFGLDNRSLAAAKGRGGQGRNASGSTKNQPTKRLGQREQGLGLSEEDARLVFENVFHSGGKNNGILRGFPSTLSARHIELAEL